MKVNVSEKPSDNFSLHLVAENTYEEASAMSLLTNGAIKTEVKFSGKTGRGTAKKMEITLLFEEKTAASV